MSEKLKDNISIFHDHHIYSPRRTVSIIGEIDIDMFAYVFKNLHALDHTTGIINVVIDSPGGCVTQGKGIRTAIKGCNNHVRAIVYGEACSAASFILQAADERIMTPDSKLMLHVGEETIPTNHPRNVDREYQILREDEKWLEDVYLEKIKEKKKRFTRSQIKSMMQFDKYLNPKEALELGLIDSIKDRL